MIDTLMAYLDKALETGIHERVGVEKGSYALLTLHRPSNVDAAEVLGRVLDAVEWIQSRMKVIFPVHPRTAERIREFGLSARLSEMRNLHRLPPLGYLEFLALTARARLVLTDSGGIQEETTVLGVPCVTLRWNTERPVTVREGTNVLAGNDPSRIISAVREILDDKEMPGRKPKLWDGKSAKRIVEVIQGYGGALSEHRGNEENTGGK